MFCCLLPKFIKKYICYSVLIVFGFSFSQEKQKSSFIDVNYFKGTIALHDDSILRLITGQPEGTIIGWNKKTFGEKLWQQRYNYPDYGVSFSFQNLKNPTLGNNYALYAHYNFYFFKRHLLFRIGQGLAYTTNPFNKINNPNNVAFGSDILSSTYILLNYKKERIFNVFGIQAGLSLIHYSNANVRAPNGSTNTLALNVGLTYNLDSQDKEYIKDDKAKEKYREPIKYNFAFRSGVNESDIIGSGQFPFYILSAYADKRLSHKSAVQFGVDAFFSKFLEELILFEGTAFPERNQDPNADYKRVGLFVGHELFINKLSIVTQLGYYVYYPFDFESRTYIRVGFKHYFGKKIFGAVTLKAHGARAEAVEFGVGIRL